MDESSLFYVQLVLRYLHILGAISLMGGAIFMRFALLPTLQALDGSARDAVHEGVRARWKMVMRAAALMLFISGIGNLGMAARYEYHVPFNWNYSMMGGLKLILAIPVVLLAELLLGNSSLAKKVQANAATVLNVNLVLAILLVFIGGVLKFSTRELKEKYRPGNAPPASAQLAPVTGSSHN